MVAKILFLIIFLGFTTAFCKPVALEVKMIIRDGDMAFDKTTLEVTAGTDLEISFSNLAAKDSEIEHSVAVVKLGSESDLLASLKKDDYEIEKAEPKYFIAKTKLLGPGAKEKITLKALKPGKYTYICLMPGHGTTLGMTGILTIK